MGNLDIRDDLSNESNLCDYVVLVYAYLVKLSISCTASSIFIP